MAGASIALTVSSVGGGVEGELGVTIAMK